MNQPALLEVGAARACRICALPVTGSRCRICEKGDYPAPGSDTWGTWSAGIRRMIATRLVGTAFEALTEDVQRAIVAGEGEVPREVRPLVYDMMRLPVSPRAYERAVRWAIAYHQAFTVARTRGGKSAEDADVWAIATADEWLASREARPRVDVELTAEQTRVLVEANLGASSAARVA